jgi:signal transduction histidine kinase/ActR/RegA family two-component response regulator
MMGSLRTNLDFFQDAACGLLVVQADGYIFRVNATMCGWIGATESELVGRKRLQDLFTVGGRVFHQTHCLPMLQVQGSVAELQVDIVHSDSTRIPMLMNVVRREGSDGTYDQVAFFIAKDRRAYERELLLARRTAEEALNARRGAEIQLQELNRALSLADRRKDEFLATLAHELRNPLAPIRNVVELLKRQLPASDKNIKPLAVLERQVSHLTHLVNDLMDASRITQGHVDLRSEQFDLGTIMQAAADDLFPMVRSAGHQLHVTLPLPPITLHADPTRITQVILNLLTNAAKYTPHGGTIWLAARREEYTAIITVRDTGIGIPPESLASVFQMFSQLTPALERAQGGLGIGLALVRGLVELHGGSISATSAGVGCGSEFEVRLPMTPLEAVAAPMELSEPPSVTKQKILIVDDSRDVTDTMTMLLDVLGHGTRAAHDGQTAMRHGAEFLPDVVILDIGLPDMSGYEVARRIRSAPWGEQVFLIAATGWGQEADRDLAIEAGFDLHLTKPIDFEALQSVLASVKPRGSASPALRRT